MALLEVPFNYYALQLPEPGNRERLAGIHRK
jgi:hypothetical protein